MSEDTDQIAEAPNRSRKAGLIAGLILACAGGAAGYTGVSKGLILGAGTQEAAAEASAHKSSSGSNLHDAEDFEFIALDPIVVNLPPGSQHSHLRLVGQLEVEQNNASHVEHLKPRIADIMNSYLRALEPEDFEDRLALSRIRIHLLARVESVVGAGNVSDFLITEFVLS